MTPPLLPPSLLAFWRKVETGFLLFIHLYIYTYTYISFYMNTRTTAIYMNTALEIFLIPGSDRETLFASFFVRRDEI
jgi:hypothetical protein